MKDANAPRTYKTGEEVYKAVCVTCHGTGAAGAPKFGNKDDWAPRISQGFDTLLKTALAGKGAMPPRGGPDDVSDYEIARAIVYMANNDGANFPEPAAPAANAAQPASGAAAASGTADAASAQIAAAQAAIAALPKAGEAPAAAAAPAGADAGKALYTSTCQACHAAGVLGAPKFGSKEDWAPRLKDSMDTVYNYALHGRARCRRRAGRTRRTPT